MAIFDILPTMIYNEYTGTYMKEYYTVAEFAAILSVTRQTVYQWIYAGEVQSVQLKRKGARRIPATELDRIKQQRTN